MANKNIQIRDLTGNNLFPKSLGTLIENTDGTDTWNLGAVEAGAQVNTIEGVQVNGTDLTPDANKKVNVVIPAAAEYSVAKASTAEEGYFATYHLTKNGTNVGAAINIPKDYLVKSASMKICQEAGVPSTTPALEVGDPYLDFVINVKSGTATDEHIYINVKGLVDIYTPGAGIDITDNEISVVTTDTDIADAAPTSGSVKFVQSGGVFTALAGKVNANAAITGATKCKITYDAKGLVTAGADLAASDIPNLASNKINALTGYAKASAAAAISTSDSLNVALGKLEYKADNAVVKNAAITGATKCKITYDAKGLVTAGADLAASDIPNLAVSKINAMTGYAKASSFTAIAETDTLSQAVGKLEKGLDTKQNTITGAATSITSNNLTASMFLASDANGKVAATAVPSNTALLTYVELT